MRILQVSTIDQGGGAEQIARQLLRAYRAAGHDAWLAVGLKRGDDPYTLAMDSDFAGGPLLRLQRRFERLLGSDAPRFAGGDHLPGIIPGGDHRLPDVLHAHNLHGPFLDAGGYFDLRWLPRLSRRMPVVLTLHDAWLTSGHCAHSFDCDRWRSGCGACPDLTIYPAIRRDATAANWRRKRGILARSRLFVTAPSQWLMGRIMASIVAPSVVEARVIPNGVDTSIFAPAGRGAARAELGLPGNARIVLFAANTIRRNLWKDYATLREAVIRLGESTKPSGADEPPLLFLALGERAPGEVVGGASIRFVPHEPDPRRVARYYQAADLYIHAAKVDTFPTTVLEALACGTPVVATAVGGIPEQINSFRGPSDLQESAASRVASAPGSTGVPTGVLVPPGDAAAMAAAIQRLFADQALHALLSRNAARDAGQRFSLGRQVREYLSWYLRIADLFKAGRTAEPEPGVGRHAAVYAESEAHGGRLPVIP